MELKDYLRILRRRWPVMVVVGLVVLAGFWAASLLKVSPYQASIEVHFKQTPLELGFFQPEDYTYPWTSTPARMALFSNPKVLEAAASRLRAKGFQDCTGDEVMGWISVRDAGIEKTVRLTAVHPDPTAPPKIARALYEGYLDYMKGENREAFVKAADRVRASLGDADNARQKAVDELKQHAAELYARVGVSDPEIQGQILSQIIFELERTRQSNMIEVRKLDARLAKLPEVERRLAEEELLRHHGPPFTSTPPPGSDLGAQVRSLNAKLAKLRKKYQEAHPDILTIKEEIQELQREMAEEIQRPIVERAAQLLEQRELLLSSSSLIEEILATEYGKLRDIQAGRTEVQTFQKRIEEESARAAKLRDREVSIKDGLGRTDSMTEQSIVAVSEMTAAVPAVAATKTASLPIVLALAVILGIVAGFLADYLSDAVRTTSDVKTHMNLPTIASIPDLRAEPHNLLELAIKSPVYEVYNKLATFLESVAAEQKAKSLLFTSVRAEEGKTTISSNVAIALAQGGERVVLIDADLRKPNIHMVFGIDNSKGMSDLLSGDAEAERKLSDAVGGGDAGLEAYLKETQVPNLHVLTSGPLPVNPVSLLKSDRFRGLLEELGRRFDLVLIDSPPHLGVVDSIVLAAQADLTVVVLAEGAVRRAEASQLKHALNQVGANAVGVVINKSRSQAEAYYYYYYRYRGYTA